MSPPHSPRRLAGIPADAPLLVPAAVIGLTAVGLVAAFCFAAGWIGPERLGPKRIINTFNANFGEHPGFRRNHAKGVCVDGYFDGNGNAAGLSVASVFGQTRTPVTGRFAIPGGNPAAPDTGGPVRSLALMFQLPDGQQWRTGMNNTPVFVVNTPQGFYAQLQATAPDPKTGKPDPAKVAAFFAAHPESAAFRNWVKTHAPSSGFANGSYYSINAFKLIDGHGGTRYVRWAFVPDTPYQALDATQKHPADFLQSDLQTQLAQGPLRWHLQLTLADTDDITNDATRAWPEGRQVIDAGTLTLTSATPQQGGDCRDINYDPTILPRGIAISDDPLLAARSAAYSRSFNKRTAEEAAQGAHS